MNTYPPVFSQLMANIHQQQFHRFVLRHQGDQLVRDFSCWDQFLCMAFAQLAQRASLRDVVLCLNARPPLLYHLGIRGAVCRSTLADANERRDRRILLIGNCFPVVVWDWRRGLRGRSDRAPLSPPKEKRVMRSGIKFKG